MKLENPLQVKPFKARRARLAKSLAEGVVVLPTAQEHHRNADTHYDYRWDSGFYYLTGFREPEAVLVMLLGAKPKTILFCREKNLEREIWDGYRFGPETAREMFAFETPPAVVVVVEIAWLPAMMPIESALSLLSIPAMSFSVTWMPSWLKKKMPPRRSRSVATSEP